MNNKSLNQIYRKNKCDFSRDGGAKLNFSHLVHFLLSLPKQSAQAAINCYIREKGLDFTMHKQSLFEAREKLSHRIFVDLSEDWLLRDCAYMDEFQTWNKFRVVAVDGSVFNVPYGADYFGVMETSGNAAPEAQAISFIDVLNGYIIRADLRPYLTSERNIASNMLCDFPEAGVENLFLFDRGFFSRKLLRQLVLSEQKFLFRVSKMVIKEINEAQLSDQIVVRYDSGEENLVLRVINFTLPNGENERFVTNLFDESLDVKDFGDLYRMRWGVETGFLMLKERIAIEDFSSAKTELILQDFFTAILVYNLTVAAIDDAKQEEQLKDQQPHAKKKYEYKSNKNLALVEIRNLLVDALLCDNPEQSSLLLQKVMINITKYIVPIRQNRPSSPRMRKYKSAKYSLNSKRGLA